MLIKTSYLVGIISICVLISGFFWKFSYKDKPSPTTVSNSIYQLSITKIDGTQLDFKSLKGRTILIVNVASKCGFTPQYEGLQRLHEKYKDKGLVIIGVPSNDFAGQEPGTAKEIQTFCRLNYNVSFLLTQKVHVKGHNKHPLYSFLTSNEVFGGAIKWNFNKFLIDPSGQISHRFGSRKKPLSKEVITAIESHLTL